MLEVTKGRTLPPWTRGNWQSITCPIQIFVPNLCPGSPKKTHLTLGLRPQNITESSSKLWSNNLLLGARSFVMFQGIRVILPTRKSSRLQCNEFHSLSRMAYDFWSWKWMIQSTWTRISLRENLQWRLMGLFNACDKFLLLRASQPKKRICCRHDHHQLLETSFLNCCSFNRKTLGKFGSPEFHNKNLDHWIFLRGVVTMEVADNPARPSKLGALWLPIVFLCFFLIQILPSKHALETSELKTYAKQIDVFFFVV